MDRAKIDPRTEREKYIEQNNSVFTAIIRLWAAVTLKKILHDIIIDYVDDIRLLEIDETGFL